MPATWGDTRLLNWCLRAAAAALPSMSIPSVEARLPHDRAPAGPDGRDLNAVSSSEESADA